MSEEVDVYVMKLTPMEVHPGKDYFAGGSMIAFFRRDMPMQDDLLNFFLLSSRWFELPNTRQQLVLSEQQAFQILREASPSALVEFQERGAYFQVAGHSEDDDGPFDIQRILR